MLPNELIKSATANEEMFIFQVAGKKYSVLEFEMREEIFTPYNLDLVIVTEKELELDQITGKDGELTIFGDDNERTISGIIRKFEIKGTKGRFRLYKVTITPWLWLLNLSFSTEMFQDMTTEEVVKNILKSSGIPADMYEFRLKNKYKKREYCVRYKESGFEFVSRLLGEEGIFYFFETTTKGHKAIFGDSDLNYDKIEGESTVYYHKPGSFVSNNEFLTDVKLSGQLITGKYSAKDYDFKEPAIPMDFSSEGKEANKYEVYDYPGHFEHNKNGKDVANINLERLSLFKETVTGQGSVPNFTTGKVFTLKDHEIDSMNKSYLLVSVKHKGVQPQVLEELTDQTGATSYSNTFTAIPDNVTFRPTSKYKKPVVEGVQTAIITGPDGEEIYTDKFGRVKVQFHWDREDKDKSNTSCWIRVSQSWTGSGYGSVSIPRIGQEVIVSFIEGDPDRPVITGRVYHGGNESPYSLPADKTKTVFKTESTPGGGGSNELTMEDKKGSEQFYIHAEKDMDTVIKNNETLTIENNRVITVGNNHLETITGNSVISTLQNLVENIGVNETRTIAENFTQEVGVDSVTNIGASETKDVGKDSTISIGGAETITIGVDETKTIENNQTETIGNDLTKDIGNDQTVTIANDTTQTIGNDSTTEITNDTTQTIGNNSTTEVGNDATSTIGNNLTAEITNDTTITAGNNVTADITAGLTATAGEAISLTSSGGDIVLTAGAATITLTNGGDITIDGANITINASGDLNMAGTAINQN